MIQTTKKELPKLILIIDKIIIQLEAENKPYNFSWYPYINFKG